MLEHHDSNNLQVLLFLSRLPPCSCWSMSKQFGFFPLKCNTDLFSSNQFKQQKLQNHNLHLGIFNSDLGQLDTNQILRHVTSMRCALRIYQCCCETIYGLVFGEMPEFNQSSKANWKANLTMFEISKRSYGKRKITALPLSLCLCIVHQACKIGIKRWSNYLSQ